MTARKHTGDLEMLESFLKKPELLTDDQVMELLKVAFRQPEVQQTLTRILKEYDLEEE